MEPDKLEILLLGTGLGFLAAIGGAFVNHLLSLRADSVKRARDREEQLRELIQLSPEQREKMAEQLRNAASIRVHGLTELDLSDEELAKLYRILESKRVRQMRMTLDVEMEQAIE